VYPIEAFEQTLEKIAKILDRHSIRYHLTGGITSVFYGEPRMTQDVDLVVDRQQLLDQIDAFTFSLRQSNFLFDESSVRSSIENHRLFQLLDSAESLKLDLYPRELIPGELDRSVHHQLFEGVAFPIVSRPDAALSKLIWVSKGSHKSRRDARQIYLSCAAEEQDHIRSLVDELSLASLLEEILAESDEAIE